MMLTAQTFALVGVRLIGLFWITFGIWQLVANLSQSLFDFEPAYATYFLRTQLLNPAVAILLGILLIAFSGYLSRFCSGQTK